MKPVITILTSLLFSTGNACAEVVDVFVCKVTKVCSQEGNCVAGNETFEYSLSPMGDPPTNHQSFQLTFAGQRVEARKATLSGPIVWYDNDGGQLRTLSFLGSKQDGVGIKANMFATLSTLTFSQPPLGSVEFLECEATF